MADRLKKEKKHLSAFVIQDVDINKDGTDWDGSKDKSAFSFRVDGGKKIKRK